MELKDVKQAIASGKIVKYDNTNYKIMAYILRLNGTEWQHLMELKDLKAKSSVVIVKIRDVEEQAMKYEVIGYQTFDTYPDGTFDYKPFGTEKEAKDYVKRNQHREGNVQGRYKVYRYYSIQEIKE